VTATAMNTLTKTMEQSPSWETDGCSGGQEISYFLWNSKCSLPCS